MYMMETSTSTSTSNNAKWTYYYCSRCQKEMRQKGEEAMLLHQLAYVVVVLSGNKGNHNQCANVENWIKSKQLIVNNRNRLQVTKTSITTRTTTTITI